MKRPIRKADDNQPELVKQIRKIPGTTVAHTHILGKGFGDILLGYQKKNFLLEIKDPKKPPSARKLSKDEEKFHNEWTGQIAIVETIEDVIKVLTPTPHPTV